MATMEIWKLSSLCHTIQGIHSKYSTIPVMATLFDVTQIKMILYVSHCPG